MKKKELMVATFLVGLLAAGCQDNDGNSPEWVPKEYHPIELSEVETRLATENNDFAFRFFHAVEETSSATAQENVFTSPLSASLALSMLANGADGTTRQELTAVLGNNTFTLDDINRYNQKLATSLGTLDNTCLFSLANSLWLNKDFQALDTYRNTLTENYEAEIRTLDFASALGTINRWCAERTNGLIPAILDDLNPQADMVLMNALYFKGRWEKPFDPEETAEGDFRNADGTTTDVELMHLAGSLHYMAQDGYSVVRLPFGNTAFNLTILLPDEASSLPDCFRTLNADQWQTLQNSLNAATATVDLKLPKFSMDSKRSLKAALQALGIQTAWGSEADFSLLSDVPVNVNEIQQAISFHVDEEGAEAAGSTVITGDVAATLPVAPVNFHVQHPFLCVLSEQSTGCILFIGKVEKL